MFRNVTKFNKQTMYKLYFKSQVFKLAYSNLHHHPLHSDSKYQRVSTLLSNYGFNYGQVNRILQSPESISSLGEDQLLSNLINWYGFNVGEKLCTVLCAYPELLTLNPDYVNARNKELMSLFTRKDISKLLLTCPSVFIDDFSIVYDKVEYIVHMMDVEQKSIVKSRALQFDLDHIKFRHIFMCRAGFYVKNKKSARNRNAPLHKIFSRNIQTFLKLTHLTEEEYKTFCQCYKEELLDEEEDSDDEIDKEMLDDEL